MRVTLTKQEIEDALSNYLFDVKGGLDTIDGTLTMDQERMEITIEVSD